jgi:hypothetical protein
MRLQMQRHRLLQEPARSVSIAVGGNAGNAFLPREMRE